MNESDILLGQLRRLEAEINEGGFITVKLHQQNVKKENMSFSGRKGRIWIQPIAGRYDISLSGKVLESEMSRFMESLCGRECDGFKQTNQSVGKADQPYWRVNNFSFVAQAVRRYAKAGK